MDICIIKHVIDIFDRYGETLRFDEERFEEVLNETALHLMDECYLVVKGMKWGIFDAMIFDEDLNIADYVSFLTQQTSLSTREALFMTSVFSVLVDRVGYHFEIPDIEMFLQQAYQQHHLSHLLILAKTYLMGFGVKQDFEKAFEIFSYLDEQNVEESSYYLGYMYEHGFGIEQDVSKALDYYYQYELSLSCLRLGLFFMSGTYVLQDEEKALDYFARSHEKEAYLYRGMLLESRREYSAAFQSYFQGASVFQKECLYKVGLFLKLGLGVKRSSEEAYRYFEYGYFLLQEDCAYELAMMFFDGVAVKKDCQQALRYLKEAALLQSYEACLLLSQFYEWGRYVTKNHRQALAYYQQAHKIKELKKI